jgi:hypothetical protein
MKKERIKHELRKQTERYVDVLIDSALKKMGAQMSALILIISTISLRFFFLRYRGSLKAAA